MKPTVADFMNDPVSTLDAAAEVGPMTDIVERLRWIPGPANDAARLCGEAADEIERLRAVLEKIASLKHGSAAALAQSALDTMKALK